MTYTLSNLIRDVYGDIGKTETFLATGGSTTTVVNSIIGNRETQPDDNYSIDFTIIVSRDAGGAGAAPEGEYGRVNAYNSTNWTYTLDTALTVAPASGDEIVLVDSEINLREMVRLANRALKEIGDIAAVDTSLTSAANKTEYALPVALKRADILDIEYQGSTNDADDNDWIKITDYDIKPAVPGSTGLLIIPQITSGRTIKITYMGEHPLLTAHNSPVSETIHPKMAIAALTKMCMRWYVASTEGDNTFWLQRYNEALQDYELMTQRYPVWKPARHGRRMPQWIIGVEYPGDRNPK